jgi:hypothetical protein
MANISNMTGENGNNNTSNTNPIDSHISISLMAQVSAYCLVLVVSLLGNSLVIITIKKDKNELKKLVMSATISHMAAADLITTVVGLPFMMVKILHNGTWLIEGTFGLVVCKIHSFAIEVGFAVSALSIAVIALERFLSVVFPLRKFLTIRSAHRIGFSVWIASCAFYSPKLYSINVFEYRHSLYCANNKLDLIKPWKELEAVIFVVLFVVTLFLYMAIVVKIQRRSSVPGRVITVSSQLARNKTSRKVIRQGLGVITIHYLCWLPYLGISISCIFLRPIPEVCRVKSIFMTFFIFILGFSNAALNPILYAATNESFRKGCKTVFRNLKKSFTARIMPLTSSTRCPALGEVLSIAKTPSNRKQQPGKEETCKLTGGNQSVKMERGGEDLTSDSPESGKVASTDERGIQKIFITS